MDTQTIDQEFEKLQAEFQDVANAVRELATKLRSAQTAGDANAGEWLGDLEAIAKEVDDEQTQSKVILLALHSFITEAAQAAPAQSAADEKPALFAAGQDPFPEGQSASQQQGSQRRHGLFGGMMGGWHDGRRRFRPGDGDGNGDAARSRPDRQHLPLAVSKRLAQIALLTAAVGALAAGPGAAGSSTAFPGLPSIYVTYNDDCTFSLSADGGFTMTSSSPPGPTLPPGVYQILILMGNPPVGYTCGTPIFSLVGPGVDSVTEFPGQATLVNQILPALQPSSIYVAEDASNPTGTRLYFSTSASGSSSSLVGPAPGTQTSSGVGAVEPDLVGSGIVPFRGDLIAKVEPAGAVTLTDGGRKVSSLTAGRYDLTVVDAASRAGFSLRKAGAARAIVVTANAFVGKKTRQVTLSAGNWTYFSTSARTASFAVVG